MTEAPKVSPLRLGSLSIPFPVGLSPMAGYTDAAMRQVCQRFGCGFTFTEVTNAQGLVHGSKPTFHLLETLPGEHHVGAHLYGCDPEAMACAAAIVEDLGRFDFIDLNAGCPVRKIVAKGSGAALMADPARMADIVAAMCKATSLPVTVKTRLGISLDTVNISEIGHAVEEAGATAISVHARVAEHKHAGPADWDALAKIKAELTIPLIGNGGVTCAAEAFAMLRETGVDGVLIGRAAIGNPWIFEQACRSLMGETPAPTHARAVLEALESHFANLLLLTCRARRFRRKSSFDPEHAAALHFRGHLVKYLVGRPGWSDVRRTLNDLRSKDDVMAVARSVLLRG